MSDRLPSDHPSIDTYRATLTRSGATRRPALELPPDLADTLPEGETIRLVIDGQERHARVSRTSEGTPLIRGAYDSPRFAREREGRNRLREWVEEAGLEISRSVLFDVVIEGFRYGLRAPGEETTYDASRPPSSGLRDIARGLEE